MRATDRQIRLVHGLLRGKGADLETLSVRERTALVEAGVVAETEAGLRATSLAREWLLRERASQDIAPDATRAATDSVPLLAPLARSISGRPPFLAPHHVEAGRRVQKLFDRAHLTPRTTMAYSPVTISGGRGRQSADDITDMAASARKRLAEIHEHLPRDCAGVVIDVCGYEKGLQTVETERGWPRRSAKLVLRIGLEQLARDYGLMSEARGPDSGRHRQWMETGARSSAFY